MKKEIIENYIKEWERVSDSKETPFFPPFNKDKRSFDDGWKLAINRMLNELKEIISKEKELKDEK
jgi:hypothetical protein